MKIDRVGGPSEVPQNEDPKQVQEGSNSPKGISSAPDGIEQYSQNANPFSGDSIFSNHEHQPQGRPFTDPSFRPEHAHGRPFQDKGTEEVAATPEELQPPSNGETERAEEAALPLETKLPEEE
jgi:hypothetical protein